MYYKVLKDGKPIDVLDKVIFLKYNMKHKRFFLSEERDAQAILSSDGEYQWHETSLLEIPVEGYDTVTIEEIDKFEYNQLRILGMKTPQEIIDAYTLSLIEGGIL